MHSLRFFQNLPESDKIGQGIEFLALIRLVSRGMGSTVWIELLENDQSMSKFSFENSFL